MLHKPQQLNPQQTAAFQHKMAALPNPHAADVALKWRERFVNVALAYNPGAVGYGVQIISAGAYGGVLGWWDGNNEAERNHAKEIWQTQTAPGLGIDPNVHPEPFVNIVDPTTGQVIHKAQPDPRAWIGINKTAYPTVALLLGAVGASFSDAGVRAVPYLLAGAYSGFGYLIGTSARDMFYKKKRDALRAAAAGGTAPASQTPANGGAAPAGNPRWFHRYRRAA